MRLTNLKITGLFGEYDYDIPLGNPERLRIITGPNGFGKTMLLNIIEAFCKGDEDFFEYGLIYTDICFTITNDETGEVTEVRYTKEDFSYRVNIPTSQLQDIRKKLPVYYIRETRLFDRIIDNRAIERFAKGLAREIKNVIANSKNTLFELNSSFPKRVMKSQHKIGKAEFEERVVVLDAKQQKVAAYGLGKMQELVEYDEESANFLGIYLSDREQSIGKYDDIIAKLDLFTTILNERRFTSKRIKISSQKGFYVETNKGKRLELTDLSSGEQHQVILLFELIFMTQKDTIVLIDEPELGLHVSWQREFVKDVLEIIKQGEIGNVIIATHSPQIIRIYSDLVYNLQQKKTADVD